MSHVLCQDCGAAPLGQSKALLHILQVQEWTQCPVDSRYGNGAVFKETCICSYLLTKTFALSLSEEVLRQALPDDDPTQSLLMS